MFQKYIIYKISPVSIASLNRAISIDNIEKVVRTPHKDTTPSWFYRDFSQTFKDQINPMLLKLFQSIGNESKISRF